MIAGCISTKGLENVNSQETESSPGTEATPPEPSLVTSDTLPRLDVVFSSGSTPEQQIRAMQLTTSWTFVDENGDGGSIMLDSPHPLQIHPSDFNEVTLNMDGNSGVIELQFSNAGQPDSISVTRWYAEYVSGNQDISGVLDKSEPVAISGNTVSVSNDGFDYVYEVYAIWPEGSSYFTFRSENSTPPVDKELVRDYIQLYMQLITDGDTAELARFLLIDGGVTDRYVEIAGRVIEYHMRYDTGRATVQYVHYHEYEVEPQYIRQEYIIHVRDGRGEMFKVYAGYGDSLVGIDVRMFE